MQENDYPNENKGYEDSSAVPYVPYATDATVPVQQPVAAHHEPEQQPTATPAQSPPPPSYLPPADYTTDTRELVEPTPGPSFADYAVTPALAPVDPNVPPQKKSRRRLWFTLGALALLLLLLGGGALFWYINANRSTPVKTLDTFCDALRREDYHQAWEQFSAREQQELSEVGLATVFSQDRVVACDHGMPNESGKQVLTSIRLTSSQGVASLLVILIKDSNDTWKIDKFSR